MHTQTHRNLVKGASAQILTLEANYVLVKIVQKQLKNHSNTQVENWRQFSLLGRVARKNWVFVPKQQLYEEPRLWTKNFTEKKRGTHTLL